MEEPEWRDRLPSRPRARRGGADFPIRALALGFIGVADYLAMRQAEAVFQRNNRARAVSREPGA